MVCSETRVLVERTYTFTSILFFFSLSSIAFAQSYEIIPPRNYSSLDANRTRLDLRRNLISVASYERTATTWHTKRLIKGAKRLNSTPLRTRRRRAADASAQKSACTTKAMSISWFSRLSVFMSDPSAAGSCKHYIWTMRTILLKCNNGALWNIVQDEYSRTGRSNLH